MIDTQVHLLDPIRYPYPAKTLGYRPSIQEAGRLDGLRAALDDNGVSRAILVQASVYGTDNSAILEAVAAEPERFRAVVMTDAEALPSLAETPGVAGVRLNMTDYAEHGPAPKILELASLVLRHGLILQLQATPEDADRLLAALPPGRVVLDHFCRADVTRPQHLQTVCRFAERDACYLKVSGKFRLTGLDDWQRSDSRLSSLCAAFGADHVLWGSDWPFINLDDARPTYHETIKAAAGLIDFERASANAAKLFGWSHG